jgi:hypothetical protein
MSTLNVKIIDAHGQWAGGVRVHRYIGHHREKSKDLLIKMKKNLE